MDEPGHLRFGKVPQAMVFSGAIVGLGRSQLAVYLTLAAHADGRGLSAFPSVRRIARLAGIGERTVQRAVQKLVESGMLRVEIRGGRHRPNEYTLVSNPVSIADGVSADETPPSRVAVFF